MSSSAPRKIVAIFWDTENCPVPSGVSASNVANAFRQLALQQGTIKTFHALVPSGHLVSSQEGKDNAVHQLELKQAGVSLLEVPESKNKNSAQISIVNELWDFAYEAKDQIRQGLAHIILIAKAADYAPAIGRLRNKGVEVTLVHNGASNTDNDEEGDGKPHKDHGGDGGILRINSTDFIDFHSLMKEFSGNSLSSSGGSGPTVNSNSERVVPKRGRAMTTPSAMWVNNNTPPPSRTTAEPVPAPTTPVPNGLPFLTSPRLRSGSYSGSPVSIGLSGERGSLEDFLSFSSPSSPLLHSSPTSSSPPSPSLSSSPTHTSPPSTPTPLDSLPDPLRTELNSLNAVLSSLRADGFKPTFKVIMPRLGSLLGSRIDRARFERMLKAAQQHLGVQVDFTLKTCYPSPPNGGMYGGFDPSRASRAQFDAPILEAFARFLGEHIGRTFPNRFDMAQWVQAFGPEPVRNLKQGPVVTLCQLAINEKLVAPLVPDSNSGSNNAASGTSSPSHHAYASSSLHGNTGLVIVEPPGLAFGFVQVNTVRARSNTTGSGMPSTNSYGWVGRKESRDMSDADISLGHSRSFGQLPSTQTQSPSQSQYRFGSHAPPSPQSQNAHYPFNQPSYSLYQRQSSGVSSLNEENEISSPFSNGDSSRSIAGLWHTPHSLQQESAHSPSLSPSTFPQSNFNDFDSNESQYLSPNIHNLTPHTSHNLSHTFLSSQGSNSNQSQTPSNNSSNTWGSTLHSPQPFRLPSPSSYYNSQQSPHFAPSPPSPSSSPSPQSIQQQNNSHTPTHGPPNKTLSSPSILSTAASTLINSSSVSSPLANSSPLASSHSRTASGQYNVNNIGVWSSAGKSRRASASALTIPHPHPNSITPLSQSSNNNDGY
eukprot:TRINITY_DN6449_c0_g1_i3.p1 TRINITY_DN6449_c0_g1~~TRINITY_DN6449_c0_g1_i3.p1  ORF type:complete len:877 (-),score=205.62 TRINITY_DN6449_c0_g1_i3:227-2857(-)